MGATTYPVRAYGRHYIEVVGTFAPQGAGANPTVTQGRGFTVVRNGVGEYLVTLTDLIQGYQIPRAWRHKATAAAGTTHKIEVHGAALSAGGTLTFYITNKTEGAAVFAAAEINAAADNTVGFSVLVWSTDAE